MEQIIRSIAPISMIQGWEFLLEVAWKDLKCVAEKTECEELKKLLD